MELSVERVSRFGIFAGGKWYNLDKFATPAPDLAAVQKGDTVTVELTQAGYISKILVDGTAVTSSGSSPAVVRKSSGYGKNDPQVRIEIARSTSVKAVLGSKLVTVANHTDLIEKMTSFILTGEFEAEVGVPRSGEEASTNGSSIGADTENVF